MKFVRLTQKFQIEEDGAVTVDWVVLTAAVVGLSVAAFTMVKSGTQTLTTSVSNNLASQGIQTTF